MYHINPLFYKIFADSLIRSSGQPSTGAPPALEIGPSPAALRAAIERPQLQICMGRVGLRKRPQLASSPFQQQRQPGTYGACQLSSACVSAAACRHCSIGCATACMQCSAARWRWRSGAGPHATSTVDDPHDQ